MVRVNIDIPALDMGLKVQEIIHGPPPITSQDSDLKNKEKLKIIKNLITLSVSLTFLFTAFWASSALQSSINSESGLGVISLALCNAGNILASFFLPSILIKKISCKWTLVVPVTGYSLFMASQFYPTFGTLVPSSLFYGITSACLLTAKATYVTKIAQRYAYLTGQSDSAVIPRFFGILYLGYYSSHIFGNLISYLILSQEEVQEDLYIDLELCGVNFCSPESGGGWVNSTDVSATAPVLARPEQSRIYILMGIFLTFTGISALFTTLFVDPLNSFGEKSDPKLEQKDDDGPSSLSMLIATVKHWKKPTQILVIPLTIWAGIQDAVIVSDFTAAYIGCAYGIQNIGYVMICFGVSAAFGALILGKLVQYTGRPFMFTLAGGLHMICLFIMHEWTPDPESPTLFYVVTGLWGLGDAVWSPQTKALYGFFFIDTPEAAFSNCSLWMALGSTLGFLNVYFFCMKIKIYSYLSVLLFGMICYYIAEVIVYKRRVKCDLLKKETNNVDKC